MLKQVKAVEESIEMCFRLKQEVGSFALMGESGFGNMDFLQACKFAEGDSRILMQKMARDRLKHFASTRGDGDFSFEETRLCRKLGGSMAVAAEAGTNKQETWDNEWETIYELANAVMEHVIDKGVSQPIE
jgi:acyl-CoA oxidase